MTFDMWPETCIPSMAWGARFRSWASSQASAVDDGVWHGALLLHPFEDLENARRVLGLLASAGQRVVSDAVWHRALLLHPFEDLENACLTLGLLASADHCRASDDV